MNSDRYNLCEAAKAILILIKSKPTSDDLYTALLVSLSPLQQNILAVIATEGEVSVSEIAEPLSASHQTVTSALMRMRQASLVQVDYCGRHAYYDICSEHRRLKKVIKRRTANGVRH